MMKKTAMTIPFILTLCMAASAQQDKGKRPSPPAQAQCKLPGGKSISVDYSSPRLKGRKVGGEVAPFGQIWRTGANEATTFVTDENLLAAKSSNIPAGSYTIFTIPEQDKWTLIINKHTAEWGIPYKYESEELARIPMTVSKLSSPVEDFTISFDPVGGGCTMHLSWGETQASVEFMTKNADMPVKP